MHKIAKTIYKTSKNLLLSPFIIGDFIKFKRKNADERFDLSVRNIFPQIFDKTAKTSFDRHYVYHTSWAVRKVRDINPEKHVDIASSLYFCGLLSAFIPVEFYDYRPAPLHLEGLKSGHADLTNLHFTNNSLDSLSCMHTIEHIGLGRYGDPIDPEGDKKACAELSRVLAPGGKLLFVTPVGSEALIEFNAHRIYTYELVLSLFPTLELVEFSFVNESGHKGIVENANPEDLNYERYACGLFVFTKTTI